MKRVSKVLRHVAVGFVVACAFVPMHFATAHAAEQGFSLQVSPSPLVTTVRPGTNTVLELQIRNTNTTTQALKMGLRPFTVNETTEQVSLGDNPSQAIQQLVRFEEPTFTLQAGQIFTQRIHINTTSDAAFTYNFAVTIAQQNPPKAAKGTSAIAGSVAVFTLVNVDRPGAVRQFSLKSVSLSKRTYEYLPASVSIKLKNTGNTDVQPTGTVFIQRHSSDTVPLATLALNKDGGFIIPGTTRTFVAEWDDGFPHYETVTEPDGTKKQKLVWKGGISKLRMGRYVAKVVAVYNDGQRDTPVMAELSFWVIPWRMLLCLLLIIIVLIIGVIVILRSFGRAVGATSRKVRRSKKASHQDDTKP
ncbi:hypothetical protein IPL85_01145 [Candidatus Saccharibacteria bacterium]|nr:MAG: hypothetical protein IPL85_01145 [Candidatus Saccharibacteria bacterium]